MMGWAPDSKGKNVPKALWAITKRVGKGCRANQNKLKHGFTLTAWQKATLQQLEYFMKQAERKHVAAIPKQAKGKLPAEFQMHCAPSIKNRKKRDFEARRLFRQKRAAEAAGEVFSPPVTAVSSTPVARKLETPPSPTDISAFPAFGVPCTRTASRWDPAQVLEPPAAGVLVPKQIVLAPVKDVYPEVDIFDDDSDWDEEDEEDFERFQNEQDLVIFD
jgi:hypothetical protein